MKFDLKKLSLSTVAGLLVGLGVGGSVGAGAASIVSYEAHAAGLKQLKADSDVLVEQLNNDQPDADEIRIAASKVAEDVDYAVDSFRSIDDNAKKALGSAKAKK